MKFHLRTALGILDNRRFEKLYFHHSMVVFALIKHSVIPFAAPGRRADAAETFHRNDAVPSEHLSKQICSTAPPVTSN